MQFTQMFYRLAAAGLAGLALGSVHAAELSLNPNAHAMMRDERFGNARVSRTVFEQAINSQALRLTETRHVQGLDATTVSTLEAVDFIDAAKRVAAQTRADSSFVHCHRGLPD